MPSLALKDGKLALYFRYDPHYVETVRSIVGREFNKVYKCWMFPARAEVLNEITIKFPGVQVAPAVSEAVLQEALREQTVYNAKVAGWKDVLPVEPMPIKTKPFKHQILGYNIGLDIPNMALLLEQGCGKTLTAIAVMGRRFLRGEIKKVLVVAPASVVSAWAKDEYGEFAVHAGFPYDVRALQGPVDKRIEAMRTWEQNPRVLQVAVINYEATWRMEDTLAWWRPDMIICDESQRIKAPGARQSKVMHNLGKRAKYRLILTGTPVTQGPLDLFSQYKFLDPGIFGTSYTAFRARYAVMGGPDNRIVVATKNLPDLVERAHRVAFRVTKKDALDLPEFTDQVRFCELEPGAREVYSDLVKESVAYIRESVGPDGTMDKIVAANVLVRLLKLTQITGGYVKSDDAWQLQEKAAGAICVSKAKLQLLAETMGDLLIEADKKVVIFARFRAEIAAIEELLTGMNTGYTVIHGDVPMNQRGERVTAFQHDPACRVFVAQIQTAGLGITLTAADTAIFYSLDFSFANYDQCRARIHRIGQKNTCTYLHLLADDTVDERIMKVLKNKKSVADAVVDNWKELF